MRLTEREAFFRHKRGIVTAEDVRRELHSQAVADRKEDERKRQAAKEATRGPALLEVDDAR